MNSYLPLRYWETVLLEIFAARATSLIVTATAAAPSLLFAFYFLLFFRYISKDSFPAASLSTIQIVCLAALAFPAG